MDSPDCVSFLYSICLELEGDIRGPKEVWAETKLKMETILNWEVWFFFFLIWVQKVIWLQGLCQSHPKKNILCTKHNLHVWDWELLNKYGLSYYGIQGIYLKE